MSNLSTTGHKSLYIYSAAMELLGCIESWISLSWAEHYNVFADVEGAQLEIQYSTAMHALLRPERYIWLTGSDHIMRIISVQKDEHRLVVNTKDATCLLDERNPPAYSGVDGGYYSRASGFAVETVLRGLISGMSYPLPNVELGELAGLSDTYPYSVSFNGGSLLDVISEICQTMDIGFLLRFDSKNKKLLFELYRPQRSYNDRYAPEYGNLRDLTYTESVADYKNVCTVVGATKTVTVGDTGLTGISRREVLLDATSVSQGSSQSSSEYTAQLQALGWQELAKHGKIENFNFTPVGELAVGTVVTASLPGTDIQAVARITAVTLTSQSGENSLETEIGTPIIRRKR